VSDQPPLPVIGQEDWGDDLNTYLSALDARLAALEAVPTIWKRTYNYNTNTTVAPSNGQIRFNFAPPSGATLMRISDVNSDGGDNTSFWAQLGTPKEYYVQDFDDSTKWVKFAPNGAIVHQTGYEEIPVTVTDHSVPELPAQKLGVTISM
jgi:hypothetical protein